MGEFVAANTPQIARIADVTQMKAMFFLTDDEVRHLLKTKDSGAIVQRSTRAGTFRLCAAVRQRRKRLIEMQVIIDNAREEVLGSRCQLVWRGRNST